MTKCMLMIFINITGKSADSKASGKSTESASILSKRCELLCTCAESILEDICARTKSGKITLDELSTMKKRTKHVELLFDESSSSMEEASSLKQSLRERYEEYEKLKDYLKLLGQLCQSVTVRVEGKKFK